LSEIPPIGEKWQILFYGILATQPFHGSQTMFADLVQNKIPSLFTQS